MWDLPRPGLEPMSPALAGRFLTTAPLGKSLAWVLRALVYEYSNWFCRELTWNPVYSLWFVSLWQHLLIPSVGWLADGEDEGSQLHRVIHARGHAPEGARVHHEGVPVGRQVGWLSSLLWSWCWCCGPAFTGCYPSFPPHSWARAGHQLLVSRAATAGVIG